MNNNMTALNEMELENVAGGSAFGCLVSICLNVGRTIFKLFK